MPGKFKPKRMQFRRKRTQRKPKSTTLVNASSLSPIPSRFITKSKYCEAVTISGTGVQRYVWNLNSLWDPNRTGVGHQPYAFDQLFGTGLLYNRYRVFKVDYVVTVANDNYNIHYAVLPSNVDTPPISNVSEARENPRCQYAVQNPGGTLKKITGSVYLPALTGKTKQQYMSDDSYQSLWNSSPSEIMTLNVYSQGLNDDVSVSMSHTVNIALVYHYEAYDPNPLDQSS